MVQNFIITIDGPVASGKGTIAEKLAKYLGFACLHSGNIYRAAAKRILKNAINPKDEASVIKAIKNISLAELNDDSLNQEEIGMMASQIAPLPAVREALFDTQRNFAIENKGLVAEGRDMGTIIFPEAQAKIFITASTEARAERRYKQLLSKGIAAIYDEVFKDLKERDYRDMNRENAPLKVAKDAIILDTSDMDLEEVFEKVKNISKKALESIK